MNATAAPLRLFFGSTETIELAGKMRGRWRGELCKTLFCTSVFKPPFTAPGLGLEAGIKIKKNPDQRINEDEGFYLRIYLDLTGYDRCLKPFKWIE